MASSADPELHARPAQPEEATATPHGNASAIIALARTSPPVESAESAVLGNGASCEAQVGDPQLLFGSSVLLRPPKGVEFLPDDGNPTFAQAAMSGGFVSACDATVKRMLVFAFAYDPAKDMAQYTNDFVATLGATGYVDGTEKSVTTEADSVHTAIDFPAAGGIPASTLHIAAVHRRGATVPPIDHVDAVYLLVYETSPDEYELLAPTFRQSGSSLFIIPPD